MSDVPPPGPLQARMPPAPAAPTNGMAVAALVLGIAGLTVLPGLGSILALAFGYSGRSEIRASGGAETGEGMAVAGIVLGWVGVAVGALLVVGLILALGLFGAVAHHVHIQIGPTPIIQLSP